MNQKQTPLYDTLVNFTKQHPMSFHVPGHKNGEIFPDRNFYDRILQLDLTELPELDDLHSPTGPIAEAQDLAADFFRADHTFFLVGGSTAGNLAMLLASCSSGDKVIVQRNCHKSIMNGLELAGAHPVFISPMYDETVGRYTNPEIHTLESALKTHPDAKAVLLTYPDYFGKTYAIQEMIKAAHVRNIPVLVDEAHGVHFSLGEPFPPSALSLGADAVVQSAHKMAPAMTMGAFLHVAKSSRLSKEKLGHYLQMVQSSSPSYPLMASLDIARYFLASLKKQQIQEVMESAAQLKQVLQASDCWQFVPSDDPLKLTLQVKEGVSAKETAALFEEENMYPELTTHNQILFIHGLAPFPHRQRVEKTVKTVSRQLKKGPEHGTIVGEDLFLNPMQELALSYREMDQIPQELVPFHKAVGYIAAEAIIPYPPGIPLILKGEKVTEAHVDMLRKLKEEQVSIQKWNKRGMMIFRQ
ncbi:aminotransferase class I/II-fold pyridoxal phosphate-dependent enzyme [Virgibacillus kimchii]